MVFCTECGKENEMESQFCYNCGAKLFNPNLAKNQVNTVNYTSEMQSNYSEIDLDKLDSKCMKLYEIEKFKDALECYDKLLEVEPDNVRGLFNKSIIYNNYGLKLIRNGKYEEALTKLEVSLQLKDKSIEIEPEYDEFIKGKSTVINNMGLTYYYLKNKDLAIKCFYKALELDPHNKEAKNHLKEIKSGKIQISSRKSFFKRLF